MSKGVKVDYINTWNVLLYFFKSRFTYEDGFAQLFQKLIIITLPKK
jgi:hypothetical protein